MLALHTWPKYVKHIVLTGVTLLVVLAYVSLCAGVWLVATLLTAP